MTVFAKVAAVQAKLAQHGISKEQTNTFDKYQFRGIDDVYNVLSKFLAEEGLVIVPRVKSYATNVVQTSQGKQTNHVVVEVDYILAAEGVEPFAASVVGEAMDRGDKGVNKAMSAAYKLMAFQLFCIPTESGSYDTESDSPQISQETVSEQDVEILRSWMARTNLREEDFCKWQQVNDVTEVPVARFAAIGEAFRRREQKLAREYAEGEQTSMLYQNQQGGTK
jgi:hypothetical protein